MLNKDKQRELAFSVKIDKVEHHPNADRLDIAYIGGWHCIVGRDEFQSGDIGIYFEIDSKLPSEKPFSDMEFLVSKHYKIKSQKIRGEISQGLLIHVGAFRNTKYESAVMAAVANYTGEERFLTQALEVTYSIAEDNKRKSNNNKYDSMKSCHKNLFKKFPFKYLMRYEWGRKLLFLFFGKKKDNQKGFPTHFPGVSKTDQERCENMTWVLEDKTPYIVTQKCDGSSATYILEKKKNKFGKIVYEFYVCSRNVRMLKPEQESFYGEYNPYWEAAIKYNIREQLECYMKIDPNLTFVCWQGEVCSPKIQANPHKLKELHLYLFHWTDNICGRMDIREAAKLWKAYNMEHVPIVDENFILPDDFEEFKLQAEGKYDPSVCEGNPTCEREGFVYYKTTDPTFSFKNVSRKYLLKIHS